MFGSEIIKLKAENKQLKKVNLELVAELEKHIDRKDIAIYRLNSSLEKVRAIGAIADAIKGCA